MMQSGWMWCQPMLHWKKLTHMQSGIGLEKNLNLPAGKYSMRDGTKLLNSSDILFHRKTHNNLFCAKLKTYATRDFTLRYDKSGSI